MASGPNLIVDVDRETGELISGWPRCKQSIRTILTTRLRTRVMRRWFGSRFLEIQDSPANEQTYTEYLGDALVSINLFEPEFAVTRLAIQAGPGGVASIVVEGRYLPDETSRRTAVSV